MFDNRAFDAHEGVHFFHDANSGLRCVIAIHSTALGPSAGGCRMWNYQTSDEMLTDALRLSQGMSYKNAMAGLELGGGKAVLWGNSRTDKSEALFRAFGRAVESLQGRYYTAEDVGIDTADIDIAAQETRYAAGTSTGSAASGDPSPVTALGVFRGIQAVVARAFGSNDLNGKTVAVQGVGSVGGYACEHLAEAGANLIITDIDQSALQDIASKTGARVVAPDEIYDAKADVFSPNALGATINPETLKRLRVKAVAGGANNQLATPDMGQALSDAGILYAPDYVINGGGIINVAAEISGTYARDWVMGKLDILIATLGEVLDQGLASNQPTNVIADQIARARIAAARS